MQHRIPEEMLSALDHVWDLTLHLQRCEKNRLTQALTGAFEIVRDALGCAGGAIWLRQDPIIRPFYASGPSADKIASMTMHMEEGIPGSVTASGKERLVKDCQNDPDWKGRFDLSTGYFIKSLLCVPLICARGCCGCIELINKKDGTLFTDADATLGRYLAAFVAVALDKQGFFLPSYQPGELLLTLSEIQLAPEPASSPLSLCIYEGEWLTVSASDPAFLTALTQLLLGMQKPASGLLLLQEQSVYADKASAQRYRRDVVGAVWPKFPLLEDLSGADNVALGASESDVSTRLSLRDALEAAGAADAASKRPAQLTAIERVRLLLARALIKAPKLLVLCEPFDALGEEDTCALLQELHAFCAERRISVVFLTRDATHTQDLAQRTVLVRRGAVKKVLTHVSAVPYAPTEPADENT